MKQTENQYNRELVIEYQYWILNYRCQFPQVNKRKLKTNQGNAN